MKERLPERLRAAIRDRDDSAEIRVTWFQLGLVTVFSVLYALAPRAEGTEGFNFVPYALFVYLLFTALRLGLAYRRLLTPPLLLLSSLLDVALICGLIYSFHIQYQEPAAFYLKAPTMLYLFLMIALRALRFDPFYVLATGLLAAGGWASLVLYAVMVDPEYPGRTRDFPMYVSGNQVLFGAEFDKILVILGVTGLLAYAIARARSTLVEAIEGAAAVSNFSRFFSPDVAKIVGSEDPAELQAGYGVKRDAAILIIDVRNFTPRAEAMAPEDVTDLLSRFHAAIVPQIVGAGGAIDKFLGDGVLATFGAVQPSGHECAEALRAVDRLVGAVERFNGELAREGRFEPLRIGIAVASGPVVVGVVGDGTRLEYTVIGRPANQASKIEDFNKLARTQALALATTHQRAVAQGYHRDAPVRTMPEAQVPGLAEPCDLVVLAEDYSAASGTRAGVTRAAQNLNSGILP